MLTAVIAESRKFPQLADEITSLSGNFQRLDIDDKGYLDEATAIKATQQSENQPYDVVRQALREVELDSSRRVELEDYLGVRLVLPSLHPTVTQIPVLWFHPATPNIC